MFVGIMHGLNTASFPLTFSFYKIVRICYIYMYNHNVMFFITRTITSLLRLNATRCSTMFCHAIKKSKLLFDMLTDI